MSKVKSGLVALYWIGSLAFVAAVGFFMFGGPDILQGKAPGPVAILTPPPPPPPPPAPSPERDLPIIYEPGRTLEPLGDLTQFYEHKQLLESNGHFKYTLNYYLYSPAKPYPQGLKFPLVLVLHDVHGVADAGEVLIRGDLPVKHPAFIAVPVLPFGKKWAMPQAFPEMDGFQPLKEQREGLKDAVDLVQSLKESYPIDEARIYVIGCSDGGFGAFGAALRYPGIFAAAVPIGSGWTAEDAKGFKIPLWVFHGAQDNFYAPDLSRNAASYIKAVGGSATYTEVPNVGHDCSSGQFYRPLLWDWLFKQHK